MQRREEIDKKGFRLITADMLAGNEEQPLKLKKGTIRRRTDGRWEARYYYKGKQYSVYSKTKSDCINKLVIASKSPPKKKKPPENSITVLEWLNNWIEVYKVQNVSSAYIKTLRHYIEHLTPILSTSLIALPLFNFSRSLTA